MIEILLFCIVGGIAGFLAGFLGIGGGVVVIPCLLFYFEHVNVLTDPMRVAIATTLCSLVGSAFSSTLAHKRKGGLLPGALTALIPGGILGASLGVFLTLSLPELYTKLLFAAFEVFVGIHFWRTHRRASSHTQTPSRLTLGLLAFTISILSAMLGIGGGVFTVPLLILLGVEMRKAIGTSAVLTLIILASGALNFVVFGFTEPSMPGFWGDIYYPAIPPIMVCAFLFAPIGAHLAHKTPTSLAKRIFGSFLIATGFYLGYTTLLHSLATI